MVRLSDYKQSGKGSLKIFEKFYISFNYNSKCFNYNSKYHIVCIISFSREVWAISQHRLMRGLL